MTLPALRDALGKAGLPSDTAVDASDYPITEEDAANVRSWYAIDAAAIAKVWLTLRLAALANPDDWPFCDNPNLGYGPMGQADILATLFPDPEPTR